MAGVLLREAFAFENVAQVAPAVGADYLRTKPIGIRVALHASRVFFVEARPAAA